LVKLEDAESRRDGLTLSLIARRFELRGWHVPDWFEQAAVVEPVDPDERRVLNVVDVAPRPAAPDDLGLVQAVDGLGECVVVRVADAADRALEASGSEPLGVADR